MKKGLFLRAAKDVTKKKQAHPGRGTGSGEDRRGVSGTHGIACEHTGSIGVGICECCEDGNVLFVLQAISCASAKSVPCIWRHLPAV